MKNKILFATTALVATASVAAADVTFSGYGRFGVKYTGSLAQSAKNAAEVAARDALISNYFDVSGDGEPADVGTTAADIAAGDVAVSGSIYASDFDGYLAATAVLEERTIKTTYDLIDYYVEVNSKVVNVHNQLLGLNTLNTGTDAISSQDAVYRLNTKTGKVALLDSSDAAFEAAATGEVDLYDGSAVDVSGAADAAAELELTDDALADALIFAAEDAAAAAQTVVDLEEFVAQLPAIATDKIASDMLITSRLRMNIDASTESDSGVTFGLTVRLQQDEGNANGFNSARFYAKTGGLEIAVGNIYGVIDNMAGLYSGSVGLTGLGWGNVVSNFKDLGYSSVDAGQALTKEAAEIIYTMGDYGFAVATNGTDTEYGVSATVSGWTFALSGSDTDTAENAEWVATVGGTIGGVTVGLATAEAVSGDTSTTLSAKFDVAAATSVTAYYNDDEANTRDDKSYGLGFSHGMGGGTSLVGGVASVNDQTIADFGVRFNF